MRQSGWVMLVLGIVAMFIIYQNVWADRSSALPEEEAPREQFLAPSFALKGLDGQTYVVDSGEKRDKALLINFWASWCKPCHDEAPDLVYLQQKYVNDLDIYGVNALKSDRLWSVEAFVEEHHIPFPVLLDEQNEVTDLYNVYGFPTSFLVDRNGVIREIIWGILPREQLEKKVKRLIRA